jgi:hypothetical protein
MTCEDGTAFFLIPATIGASCTSTRQCSNGENCMEDGHCAYDRCDNSNWCVGNETCQSGSCH